MYVKCIIIIIITYRQRSISMLFRERVPLLLGFLHDMLSICHHLQSMVRSLIPSDLLYCMSHPATNNETNKQKQEEQKKITETESKQRKQQERKNKLKNIYKKSKQSPLMFASSRFDGVCSAYNYMHENDDCMCWKLSRAKHLKLLIK